MKHRHGLNRTLKPKTYFYLSNLHAAVWVLDQSHGIIMFVWVLQSNWKVCLFFPWSEPTSSGLLWCRKLDKVALWVIWIWVRVSIREMQSIVVVKTCAWVKTDKMILHSKHEISKAVSLIILRFWTAVWCLILSPCQDSPVLFVRRRNISPQLAHSLRDMGSGC